MRNLLKALTVISLALLLPILAMGQAISGDLVGTIRDSSGAVVANATVTATNLGTQRVNTVTTNQDGAYHFSQLPVGHYSVQATSAGLTGGIKDVEVSLNKTSTANITAAVSSATTTVEVSAQSVAVDTTTPQIQNTFTQSEVANLPIAATGSGVINLSLLNAGVATQGGVGLGTGPSISGQRPRNNNFTIEGVDNNSKSVTGPLVQMPNDAVENFTVLQNQFSPEFGHSSGGQFNQTVKSGTNSFHGGGYEYFQNRNLNAQDSLVAQSQRANGENPFNTRYDNNRFGGQIGGPIIKNKLFFYSLVEYNPIGNVISSTGCAPTSAGYTALSAVPGVSTTNLQQFQSAVGAAGAQAVTGDPNCNPTESVNGVDIPFGPLGFGGAYYTNLFSDVNSVDWNASDKDSLRVRYSYIRSNSLDTAAQIPSFWTNLPTRNHIFTLGEYHNFSPNVTNEFRLGFNHNSQYFTVGNQSFPGLGTYPNLIIGFGDSAGVQLGADPNAPQFGVQNTYQVVDNLSWLKGKHNLKFGIEYREYISPQGFTQRARGDYDYTTYNDYFMDNVPDYIAERSIGNTTYYGNQNAIYWYANDEFRATQHLTLNLGIRYEWTNPPLSERQWQPQNAISNTPGLVTFGSPTSQTHNFAPRVGFAYSPGNSGDTSIRGGFAMAYDVLYDNLGLLSAPPQVQQTCDAYPGDQSSMTAGCFWTDPTLGQAGFLAGGGLPYAATIPPITDPALAKQLTGGYIPNQSLPYSETWNLGIQHTFGGKYVAEARYVGTHGVHLPVQMRLNRQERSTNNLFLPVYLTNPGQTTLDGLTNTYAAINSIPNYVPAWTAGGFDGASVVAFENYGGSIYNGLQTQLSRSYSNGLQFQVAWTWSHAQDNSTADVFSTYITPRRPEQFQCWSCDWSTSALDRRHRVTAEFMYDLPMYKNSSSWMMKNLLGNWTVSPILTWQSPEMATVQAATDINGNGDSAGDRVFYNPNGVSGTGSATTPLTNTAGDTVAYLATNPNAQYIIPGKYGQMTTSRNTLAMPYITNVDMTVIKQIKITERQSLQFQAQAVNLFNTAQHVAGPISDVAPGTGFTGSNVLNTLKPTNPSFNNFATVFSNHPRQMQLVLKYNF